MSNLSKISFGTWGLSEWGNYSEDYCREICGLAYKSGIRTFDTASVYGGGKAENFLSSLPNNSFFATKIPSKNRSKEINEAYESSWVEYCVNQSKERLKRDYLDLVQLHNWDYKWSEYNQLIDLMDKLKCSGFVKHWGISLPFDPQNLDNRIFDEQIVEYFQVHYNLLQQQNKEVIKYLKQKNKKVLLRSVLLHGFLLDSINPPFSKNYSSKSEDFIIEKSKLYSDLEGRSRLEYCLDDAFSTGADSIILGITKKKHIVEIEKYL